ncbi:MAG: DsrE family protein [Acidimicrobiales bacterium]
MKVLVILQGPAYGTEASYNGLRLAGNLAKRDGVEIKIFCFGDAVGLAVAGQQLPNGYYHLDRMLQLRRSPRRRDRTLRHLHGCPWDHRRDAHRRDPPIQPR